MHEHIKINNTRLNNTDFLIFSWKPTNSSLYEDLPNTEDAKCSLYVLLRSFKIIKLLNNNAGAYHCLVSGN